MVRSRCFRLKKIKRSKHSSLIERTNRSAYALHWGTRGGQSMSWTPESSRICRKLGQYLVSRSMIRCVFPRAKPSRPSVNCRATCFIHWPLGDSVVPQTWSKREGSSITKSVEKREQAIPTQHFGGEEVRRDQSFPVRLDELAPGSVLAPFRRWCNSVPQANVIYGRIADAVAQVF